MGGWVETALGLGGTPLQVGAAIVLVGVVLGVWLLARRRRGGVHGGRGRNAKRRLALLETANVDQRRQLILIRRDNTEHLIMIGGPSDIVVESGIPTGQGEPRIRQERTEPPMRDRRRQDPPPKAASPEPPEAVATIPVPVPPTAKHVQPVPHAAVQDGSAQTRPVLQTQSAQPQTAAISGSHDPGANTGEVRKSVPDEPDDKSEKAPDSLPRQGPTSTAAHPDTAAAGLAVGLAALTAASGKARASGSVATAIPASPGDSTQAAPSQAPSPSPSLGDIGVTAEDNVALAGEGTAAPENEPGDAIESSPPPPAGSPLAEKVGGKLDPIDTEALMRRAFGLRNGHIDAGERDAEAQPEDFRQERQEAPAAATPKENKSTPNHEKTVLRPAQEDRRDTSAALPDIGQSTAVPTPAATRSPQESTRDSAAAGQPQVEEPSINRGLPEHAPPTRRAGFRPDGSRRIKRSRSTAQRSSSRRCNAGRDGFGRSNRTCAADCDRCRGAERSHDFG